MEGVTDPVFRDLVLERNGPQALGGAFTEFARVVGDALPRRTLRAHLGTRRFPQPVGLQLMGANPDAVAASAVRAFEEGAPLVDLNFGCPSKGALRGCAGSSMLDDPPSVERLVRTVANAVGPRPVTAKIRAGGDDDSRLEEIARAAQEGGAALLTVHCRTRAEGYRDTADWERLRRAVAVCDIPVCGNGGVEEAGDLPRLLAETGCRFAMVGRAALGDPWIFRRAHERADEASVSAEDAAGFLLQYAERQLEAGRRLRGAVGRVKQLLQHWSAGGLLGATPSEVDERRGAWLRERDPERLLERIAARCGWSWVQAPDAPAWARVPVEA